MEEQHNAVTFWRSEIPFVLGTQNFSLILHLGWDKTKKHYSNFYWPAFGLFLFLIWTPTFWSCPRRTWAITAPWTLFPLLPLISVSFLTARPLLLWFPFCTPAPWATLSLLVILLLIFFLGTTAATSTWWCTVRRAAFWSFSFSVSFSLSLSWLSACFSSSFFWAPTTRSLLFSLLISFSTSRAPIPISTWWSGTRSLLMWPIQNTGNFIFMFIKAVKVWSKTNHSL